MLIQMPRGSSDQAGTNGAEARNAFEEALRRDLASAPVVSYDPVVGSLPKRIGDCAFALLTLPAWLPVMLIAAGVSKLRHRAPVFVAEERIGYGGRVFDCYMLRIKPPSAKVEQLFATGEGEPAPAAAEWTAIEGHAEGRRAKWRRAFERLPQMFNVIRGDMAIVGPLPLSRDSIEPLKSARRHYLSARPGLVGVSGIVDASEEPSSQYKIYAKTSSMLTDALIFWDGIRSLRNRGELWKPGFKLSTAAPPRAVVVRRRSAS
jgi:exopolysaccharide production protein ExoY